ncbi:hypothetical protein YPPY72_1495, partial [Yersinia pestis PY-72]
MLLRRKVFK